jgi:glycosyltransferase involved in cell wall biosynthesis
MRYSVSHAAIIGNYLPRQCGIATFTADLRSSIVRVSPECELWAVAMTDNGQKYHYPPEVRYEIHQDSPAAYRGAADWLACMRPEVVSLQHEYGIFGGEAGAMLLHLLREVRFPIVTTLHTILQNPTDRQRAVLEEVAGLSQRVVTMSWRGAEILSKTYGIPMRKIDFIHHGIPPPLPAESVRTELGLANNRILLTSGLLGSDKGIEYALTALPKILDSHPDVLYLVVGATHPHVKKISGEKYRDDLLSLAAQLGVQDRFVMVNRFVSPEELNAFIAASDIYVTPYLKMEQITSGALARAFGAGKAVISTPYWYAEELLADGRGVLVPTRDSDAIANAAINLLSNDSHMQDTASRAGEFGRAMYWEHVANDYLSSFQRARDEYREQARVRALDHKEAGTAELPDVDLRHLKAITDDTGILQHAKMTVPNYAEGYCLDDNARALKLAALLSESGYVDAREVRSLVTRYLSFVAYAFDAERGRFRNFMAYSREWAKAEACDDCQGRAIEALGAVIGHFGNGRIRLLAKGLFDSAIRSANLLQSPRALAFALIGIEDHSKAFPGDFDAQRARIMMARKLHNFYRESATEAWPWFEDVLAYQNAILSHALIVAGSAIGHEQMVHDGIASLHWLMSVQTGEGGVFSPVGSDRVMRRGQPKPPFAQQPLEACASVAACVAAWQATKESLWTSEARRAFDWYLGKNDLGEPLYDPATGGCRDGLDERGPNENQGAESTLSFLLSLISMRLAESATPSKASEFVQSL